MTIRWTKEVREVAERLHLRALSREIYSEVGFEDALYLAVKDDSLEGRLYWAARAAQLRNVRKGAAKLRVVKP